MLYTGPVDSPLSCSRLPRETDAAWGAFLFWRDSAYPQGTSGPYAPRSVERVALSLGLPLDAVRIYAATYQWHERAGAYDRALEALQAESMPAVDRHKRLLNKARGLVESELDRLISRAERDATLKPSELEKLMGLIIKFEREIAAEKPELEKPPEQWDLSKLTFTELKLLEELKQKATRT